VPRIMCSVKNCMYQEKSECRASSIQVKPSTEDLITSVTDDTACQTFRPRNAMIEDI